MKVDFLVYNLVDSLPLGFKLMNLDKFFVQGHESYYMFYGPVCFRN